MQYKFGGEQAVHASDIPMLFWNKSWKMVQFLENYKCIKFGNALKTAGAFLLRAPYYQSWFTSFARFGNPNRDGKKPRQHWDPASDDGEYVTKVLDFRNEHAYIIKDEITSTNACDFWRKIAFQVEKKFVNGTESSGLFTSPASWMGSQQPLGIGNQA